MQDLFKSKLWMGGIKEQGCIKAGSLHTACGLPQSAHRICPERMVPSAINLFNSSNDFETEKLFTCARHGTISLCNVCGVESVDIIPTYH